MQAVDSWIQKVEASDYRPLLASLFERYVDVSLEYCRRNFTAVVNLPAISQVQTICKILEGFLPKVSFDPLLSLRFPLIALFPPLSFSRMPPRYAQEPVSLRPELTFPKFEAQSDSADLAYKILIQA